MSKLQLNLKRSNSAKEQHRVAKQSRDLYSNLTGDTSKPYSDFLRKGEDNPIYNKIDSYRVSYDLNYKGVDKKGYSYTLEIEQETFEIYMLKGDLNKDVIDQRVRNQIGDIFMGQSKTWFSNNVKVDINRLRGIESSSKIDLKEIDFFNLATSNSDLKGSGKKVKLSFNGKKPREYDLNLWF